MTGPYIQNQAGDRGLVLEPFHPILETLLEDAVPDEVIHLEAADP